MGSTGFSGEAGGLCRVLAVQRGAQEQRVDSRITGSFIIPWARAHLDKTMRSIKRPGRAIVSGDLQKNTTHSERGGMVQPHLHQLVAQSLSLRVGVHCDRQQFGFVVQNAPEGEPAWDSMYMCAGQSQQVPEFRRRPGSIKPEGRRMDLRHFLRRQRVQDRIAGGASRAGAASAARRYRGAGREDVSRQRPAAIRAMASATG